MHRPLIAINEIYHIYNRGVEKRTVFLEDKDYLRFIHDLFEFNNTAPTPNITYHLKQSSEESSEVGLPNIKRMPRKLLVEILAFCLMPNHFHMMVRPRFETGITEFMRKLGTGYTNYFNRKYQRVGPLFQGKYKIVRIADESHFIHLPYYIHLNPLDLVIPAWRDLGRDLGSRTSKSWVRAMQFLKTYRWSSHLDYCGKKNFPFVTQREFLLDFFDGSKNYTHNIEHWIQEKNLESIASIVLE